MNLNTKFFLSFSLSVLFSSLIGFNQSQFAPIKNIRSSVVSVYSFMTFFPLMYKMKSINAQSNHFDFTMRVNFGGSNSLRYYFLCFCKYCSLIHLEKNWLLYTIKSFHFWYSPILHFTQNNSRSLWHPFRRKPFALDLFRYQMKI